MNSFFLFQCVLLFLIGIALGSFLNVLIDRLSTGRSFVKGRSYCEHCKKTLRALDLIPLFSYLLLGGKCRFCKKRIPFRLFVVELLIGLTLPALYLFSETMSLPLVSFISLFILVYTFVGIFFADIEYGIIPDLLVIASGIATLFYLYFTGQNILIHALIGIASLSFFLFLFIITKGRGMGFGDVKLAFILGFLLGFPNILVALYMAFLTGASVSIILVIWRKVSFSKGTIPFGPFLVLSALCAFFMGKDMILPLVLQFL